MARARVLPVTAAARRHPPPSPGRQDRHSPPRYQPHPVAGARDARVRHHNIGRYRSRPARTQGCQSAGRRPADCVREPPTLERTGDSTTRAALGTTVLWTCKHPFDRRYHHAADRGLPQLTSRRLSLPPGELRSRYWRARQSNHGRRCRSTARYPDSSSTARLRVTATAPRPPRVCLQRNGIRPSPFNIRQTNLAARLTGQASGTPGRFRGQCAPPARQATQGPATCARRPGGWCMRARSTPR